MFTASILCFCYAVFLITHVTTPNVLKSISPVISVVWYLWFSELSDLVLPEINNLLAVGSPLIDAMTSVLSIGSKWWLLGFRVIICPKYLLFLRQRRELCS